MRTIGYFAAAAILILIGLGMWTIPTTLVFVPSAGLDPLGTLDWLGTMTTVKGLPAEQYDDYALVFTAGEAAEQKSSARPTLERP
ncbi:MAG: hypothetical protein WBG18_25800 [Xanthobacteraceae bacterium]|jgi:hypothetical protein